MGCPISGDGLAIDAKAFAVCADEMPALVFVFARATVNESFGTLATVFTFGFTDGAISFEVQESLGWG
jgi:hypothetical protein